MARAKAEQEKQWFAEQKGYEKLFPDDDVRGCFGGSAPSTARTPSCSRRRRRSTTTGG